MLYKLTVVLSSLGWWFVEDKHGRAGWAPATYLGPVVDRAKQASNSNQSSIIGESKMNRPSSLASMWCIQCGFAILMHCQ